LPAITGSFMRARALRRAAVVGSSAAAAVLLLAVPALAHITITPDSVPAGSAAVLTFHVPNEEAHADTTTVDVQIPTAHPIAQLLVKPVPGWTSSVRAITLRNPIVTDDGQFTQAVSEVIWSGGRILPGQFQDFTVSADPLPAGVSQLAFKAIQTYSNGDVVRWIDLAQPGQPAPDHPAPVLKLTTAAATATAPVATAAAAAGGSGSDGTARALGVAGLVAGLLALVMAGWRRRQPAPAGGRAGPPARADREGMPADEQAMAAEPAGAKAAKPRTPEPAGTKAAKPRTPEPAGTNGANGARPRSQPRRRR
jgi:periplasmic copper chaperone A